MKRLASIIFIVTSITAWSQAEFRFKNLTINDGLSQSSAKTFIQDDLNALWIGTQDGLNRYDGKTFEVFTSYDTEGLESEHINCSLKDQKGNLWFGTSNSISKYDIKKEAFETYKPKGGAAFFVRDIALDYEGNIWITTTDSGLYSFDRKEKTFQNYSGIISTVKTNNVEVIGGNDLLISTDRGELFRWKVGNKKAKKVNINTKTSTPLFINKLVQQEGKVFLATNQGAFSFNKAESKVLPELEALDQQYGLQNISDLYLKPDFGWVICTINNGLFYEDDEGRVYHYRENFYQKTALLFNELNTVFLDASGVFWIGSRRGISSFNPSQRGFLGVGASRVPEMGLPSLSVWCLTEDNTSQYLYVGTDNGVSKFDKQTGKFRHFIRSLSQSEQGTGEINVLSLQYISENQLLVGCADGLFKLTINQTGHSFKPVNINGHKRVYSIVHWKENKYWLATKDGAILFDNNTGKSISFEYDPNNEQNTITKGYCRSVYKDNSGDIWFATSTGGLNKLSITDNTLIIQPYKHNKAIKSKSSNYIASIYNSAQGEYWLATSGSGLLYWNESTKTVKQYSKREGLPNNVIYGIVPGNKGSLWLSTNKGLCNFDIKSETSRNFTEQDGLMSNEFNLGAYLKSRSGIIYFGGIHGYNYFSPEDIMNTDHNVEVVFTKFRLENDWLTSQTEGSPLKEPLYNTTTIDLSYKQRSFTFRFQPSDISFPELLNYKYVLDGSEEGEVLLGTVNEIHFSALSPGEYTLKVYARLGDGKWSVNPATITIRIAYPFWLTIWFWAIVLVVVSLTTIVYIRIRTEASRREQVRLEMKIRDRTREIKNQNKKIESQKQKIEEERNKVLEQQRLLQIEKDKSENLLKNVIPESTAEELKKRGKARARAYKTVSVLFTDFVGFTKISDRMSATELVKKLDVYFTKFDQIIVKNNLEKIKTIGDAYMCAGGVPVRNNTNPIDACLAAIQIQNYMAKLKHDAIANGREYWELRLGINTGEVTAGVIGSERLAYDIWGATVNQAQRMEMLGEPGKVTITGATFKHIEPYFECTFIGKAQSKSRGLIDMYTVERIKPELSMKQEGIVPNKRFNQIVNLHLYSSINYYKAERHIMRVLEQRLSKKLHYHSINHTKDVVKAVERLALLENVTDEGLFLLKSAATYHDAGFVEQYENNEAVGARLADEILPKYGYTEKHIERIKELIYVTEIPHQPKNKLEEIICDADLDYLGRSDFHEISNKLKQELIDHGKVKNDKHWDEIQVSFLTKHKYFTKTALKTREKKKQENLQEVIKRLEEDEYEN